MDPTESLNETEEISTTLHPLCYTVDTYHIVTRFWLVVVLGTTLSVISIIFNIFVFTVFITSRQHRNSYNLYLLLLAMFDVFIGISYITLLANKVLINWTVSYTLKYLWVKYMIPMLTVSHIAMTASTYLITFAAIERYCITVNSGAVTILQNHRKIIAFIAVMCGVVSKGTFLVEIDIVEDPDCPGTINEWQLKPPEFFHEYPTLNKIWRIYFRNIFTIIAPFFILLYLNAGLVYKLQEHRRAAKSPWQVEDKLAVKQKKARILAATRTLVILVCTYLLSNLLSVIITFWEYIDTKSLREEYTLFYVLAVDLISVLTVLASCLRLPIYVSCQPLLRKEMKQFIAQLWTRKLMSRRMTLIENSQLTQSSLLLEHSPVNNNNNNNNNQVEYV